jgi:hypothetical protein
VGHPALDQAARKGNGAMPSHPRNLPEQEHSIKARAHELFVEPTQFAPSRASKPFLAYLRETPAQPLSPLATWVLWILGILVVVLFLAALWRITHRRGAVNRLPPARPPARETTLGTRPSSSLVWTDRPGRGGWTAEPTSGPDLLRMGNPADHRRCDRAGSVAASPPTAVATATWLRA